MRIGGGWRMLCALWRMNSINAFPRLSAGDILPGDLCVVAADSDADVKSVTTLASLCRPNVPLVLNFGSVELRHAPRAHAFAFAHT